MFGVKVKMPLGVGEFCLKCTRAFSRKVNRNGYTVAVFRQQVKVAKIRFFFVIYDTDVPFVWQCNGRKPNEI